MMEKMVKRKRNFSLILIDGIILLIILVIVVPHLLALSTNTALYFIITDSMTHVQGEQEAFFSFWESLGLNRPGIEKFPFLAGFEVGDLVIVKKDASLKVGNVVVYQEISSSSKRARQTSYILIHRAISVTNSDFSALGDRYITNC